MPSYMPHVFSLSHSLLFLLAVRLVKRVEDLTFSNHNRTQRLAYNMIGMKCMKTHTLFESNHRLFGGGGRDIRTIHPEPQKRVRTKTTRLCVVFILLPVCSASA